MGFGVFIHRSDSIYDDSPAEYGATICVRKCVNQDEKL